MSHAVHAVASGHAAQPSPPRAHAAECPGGDEAWPKEGLGGGGVRGVVSRAFGCSSSWVFVRRASQAAVRDGSVTVETLVKHVSNFATCFEVHPRYDVDVIFVVLVSWASKLRSRHAFRP